MKDFIRYFLGEGTQKEFASFSPAHFLPILIMLGVILLIYRYRKPLADWKWEKNIRYVMAFILIISEMSYYWRLVALSSLETSAAEHLPITVCGWVVVFASYMVLGKSQTLFDICYFWLLSGSIFALATPTVIDYTGPTRFRYYQFWVEHTMGYVAVFYMIFVHKMRPTIKSLIKAYIGMVILAVVAYCANSLIGPPASYLFMTKADDSSVILDILPSNFALRILIMAAAVSAMFFVAYAPWFLKDRKARKAACVK